MMPEKKWHATRTTRQSRNKNINEHSSSSSSSSNDDVEWKKNQRNRKIAAAAACVCLWILQLNGGQTFIVVFLFLLLLLLSIERSLSSVLPVNLCRCVSVCLCILGCLMSHCCWCILFNFFFLVNDSLLDVFPWMMMMVLCFFFVWHNAADNDCICMCECVFSV